jgi:uncharacterized protein with ParB-like and HNH nuclease domain
MPIELTATKTNLNSLLGVPGQQFVIPEYQRPYAWGDDQVDELWEDLLGSLGAGHFMGSLVLNVEHEDAPQVIDGQQRLTTLVVLLALIRDRYHDIGSQYAGQPDQLLLNSFAKGAQAFKLKSGDANWPVLRDFVLRSPADKQRKALTQLSSLDKSVRTRNKRLVSNAKRLAKHLNDHILTAGNTETVLYALEQHIRTGLEFVAIKVGNVADAFLLFETLNDRGLRLSAADLLKSHILSQIAKETNDNGVTREAASDWDALIDSLGSVDVTRFLRHYLLMSRSKVRKDDVFDEFRKDVKEVGGTTLLERLRSYAVDYGRLLEPANVEDAHARTALEAIHGQNSVTHFVLLLPALHHLDGPDFARVCRMAEVLSFRWVVCGLNAQELESHYAKTAQLLDSSQGDALDQVLAHLRSVMPGSDAFQEGFRQVRMGVKYVTRYVLASIERAMNPVGELKPSDEVHIEHILPRTVTEFWENRVPEDEDYGDVAQRWGNLTLLHQAPNQQISNGPFEAKRALYAKSDLRITREVATLDDWNHEAIDMRQRWLAAIADQLWSPDFDPKTLVVPAFPYRDPTAEQHALEELAAQGESLELEFKSTARWDTKQKQGGQHIEHAALRAIAGLANAVGGTLLIGVDDAGTITGIEPDLQLFKADERTADQYELWLNSKVKSHLGMGLATQIETHIIPTDKGQVCRVDVPAAGQPIFLKWKGKEEFYARVNNATQRLEGSVLLEYRETHWA